MKETLIQPDRLSFEEHELVFVVKVISILSQCFALILEIVARCMIYIYPERSYSPKAPNTAPLCTDDNPRRHTLPDFWGKAVPKYHIFHSAPSYSYSSKREVLPDQMVAGVFNGLNKYLGWVVKRNPEKVNLGAFRNVMGNVCSGISTSKHERGLHKVTQLLVGLLAESDENLLSFISANSDRHIVSPHIAVLRFLHCMRCCCEENTYRFECGMTLASLFGSYGVTTTQYFTEGYWATADRSTVAALILLFGTICVTCGDDMEADSNRYSGANEIDRNEEDSHVKSAVLTFEKVLKLTSSERTLLSLSGISKESDNGYETRAMFDFVVSTGTDFIDKGWSMRTLQCAIWVATYGRDFISQKEYDMLIQNKNKVRLNLRHFEVRNLLILSTCGVVRFTGVDTCMFNITGNEEASITIDGFLPLPSIQDLESLGLVEEANRKIYKMRKIPGKHTHFKGIPVGNRILLVQSHCSQPFKADPKTRVG